VTDGPSLIFGFGRLMSFPTVTMDANSQLKKLQARAISPLGTTIKVVNLAKLVSGMTPATAVCFCVIVLLMLIKVRLLFSVDLFQLYTERTQDFMESGTDYIEFGRACLSVCSTLSQLMNGKKLEDLSQAWRGAVTQLTTWVEPAVHDFGSSQTTLSAQNCGGYPGDSRREPLQAR